MPTFSYKAVNEEGKDVRGTVEAESIEAATVALQGQKLENVVVTEAMRLRKAGKSTQPSDGGPTSFAFEGTATDGTIRRGTIQAESKRHAFDRLRQEQKLALNMLSPVGVTPQFKDDDLLRWQRDSAPAAVPVSAAKKAPVAAMEAEPVAAFHDIEKQMDAVAASPRGSAAKTERYYPLVDTIRLYAGWLLAWYIAFVALGYYTFERQMPWDIPIVEGFFFSPLIFRFITAIFLFLAFSSLHKLLRGKILSGALFLLLGCGLYILTLIYG